MDFSFVKQKLMDGIPLNYRETAILLKNHMPSLSAFMIENNPGSVNYTLRNVLGYNHLGFAPNQKALARQMEIFIESGNKNDFNQVVRNFQIDGSKLPEELVNEIKKEFINVI